MYLVIKLRNIVCVSMLMVAAGVSAQPVLHYDFNNSLLDSSAGGYHLSNDPNAVDVIFSNDTVFGQGQSASFNDASALISNKHYVGSDFIVDFSASVWFKSNYEVPDHPDSVNLENYSECVQCNKNWAFLDFDRSEYFGLSISGDGQLALGMNVTGSLGIATVDSPNLGVKDIYSNKTGLNDGQWHHAHVTHSAANGLKFYIDGQVDLELGYFGSIGTTNTRYAVIGDGSEADVFAGNRNDLYYDGLIDELTYWENEKLLSQNELTNIGGMLNAVSNVSTPAFAGALSLLGFAFRRRSRTMHAN